MFKSKWMRIKEIEDPFKLKLEKGEYFLHGIAMIGQKETKKIGDQITYYEVIKSEGNSIEYMQVFDNLQEDRIDERD